MPLEIRGQLPADDLNTDLAAALGTIGVVIRSDKQTQVLSRARGDIVEDQRVRFHLGFMPAGGDVTTRGLIKQLRTGELEEKQPDHALLDALAGPRNRARLLDWIKSGMRMRLAQCPGTARTRYVAGDELELIKRTPPHLQSGTHDIKIVAALGRVGIPLLRWEGEPGHRVFWVPQRGHILGGIQYDADDLVRRLRSGELEKTEPLHPFLIAWECLLNRERLLNHINRETELLLIRAPGTTRSAFVRVDATSDAHDLAANHLKHGTPS